MELSKDITKELDPTWPTIAEKVSNFLARIKGRRAVMAKESLITWDEAEHMN
jgi:hypothetical protein